MSAAAAAIMGVEPIRDLEIEQWVHEHYGFVPHPFWISHCKELYLGVDNSGMPGKIRKAWHECPADKRAAIRDAFLHFQMLSE
jgi:hypothetical protein